MFGFQQIPYPAHKSPMDGDTANRDPDWLLAASTDRIFALPPNHFNVSLPQKLHLLESTFWPPLIRWVLARQLVLPCGAVLGGWWRADMHGMLDWYRECLHLVSRWDDAVAAHRDGVWRLLLETSPWRDWPEFGGLMDGDPGREGMEDAFLDVWEAVANARPLVLDKCGVRSSRGGGLSKQLLEKMGTARADGVRT